MNLKVLLPFRVFTETTGVSRIVVETAAGSFGLLPHRLNCVAALVPGIRTYETETRNTLDISAVPVVHGLSHLPVVVDPSHSGGRRDLVVPLSRAAMAVGADGIIVDVHPRPEEAWCDGPQALFGAELRALAASVRQLPPLLGRRPAADLTSAVQV